MTPLGWRNGRHSQEELAALLDGEISDFSRVEQLKTAVEGDGALKGEYESQRQIKLLLNSLAETHEAPDYLATRVLGEISARKRDPRLLRVPAWGAALSAVALFALGYGVAVQLPVGAAGGGSSVFDSAPVQAHTAFPPAMFRAAQTNMFSEQYVPEYSAETYMAADADASGEAGWLSDFIELGQEAHSYRKTVRMTNGVVTPDMSSAVLVVNSGK